MLTAQEKRKKQHEERQKKVLVSIEHVLHQIELCEYDSLSLDYMLNPEQIKALKDLGYTIEERHLRERGGEPYVHHTVLW